MEEIEINLYLVENGNGLKRILIFEKNKPFFKSYDFFQFVENFFKANIRIYKYNYVRL